jgi:hypothetical protein
MLIATRTYWLASKGKGSGMQVVNVAAGLDVSNVFIDDRHYEEDFFAFLTSTDDPEADYWFWSSLRARNGRRTRSFDLPAPAAQEDTGSLVLRLYGNTNLDHVMQVEVNGEDVGPVEFSGNVHHEATLELPAAVFAADGENLNVVLTLDDSPTPGDGESSVFLDSFSATYTRAYATGDDSITYPTDGDSITYPTDGDTRVSGFAAADIITLDITDTRQPSWITGGAAIDDGGSFSYSIAEPGIDYG